MEEKEEKGGEEDGVDQYEQVFLMDIRGIGMFVGPLQWHTTDSVSQSVSQLVSQI